MTLPAGDYWPTGHCDECGPQPPGYVHSTCHECGHPIDAHTEMTLRCRVCGNQCGVSTIYPEYGVEHGWWGPDEHPEPADADELEQRRLL